uniref:Uncharacterized protein n=1 Tax=Rhizophagus irregularis (strain DAOM 181602 / DAOM 197198 / MUCL 43194) TaxID=747089 RepID=U9SIZ5_RHIID
MAFTSGEFYWMNFAMHKFNKFYDKCFYYDNFTNINLSLYSEPFNINFLPSSLELSEPPSISPVLPFVLSVKPLLTSDNNFTDIEPSLPLEPSFGNSNYQYNLAASFGCLPLNKSYINDFLNLQAETIDDNFIEVVDEPQITLKAILDCIDTSNIIENLLQKELFAITFDDILDNSPVLTALESSTEVNTTSRTVDFTLQSLRQLQGSCHKENAQRIIPQRSCPQVGGRFGRFGKKNKVFSK